MFIVFRINLDIYFKYLSIFVDSMTISKESISPLIVDPFIYF